MNHLDQMTKDANVKRIATSVLNLELCDRCDGTGNQLYSMWQKCEKCDGRGTLHVPVETP